MNETEPHDTPLDVDRRRVAQAVEQFKLPGGAELLDRFETSVRHHPSGAVHYTDLSGSPLLDAANGYMEADVGGWLRYMKGTCPHLFDADTSTRSAETAPAPQVDWSRASMTEKMIAARRGDKGAKAALGMKSAEDKGPAYTGMSALMIRARSGDTTALDVLNSAYLNRPTR